MGEQVAEQARRGILCEGDKERILINMNLSYLTGCVYQLQMVLLAVDSDHFGKRCGGEGRAVKH